MSAHNRLDAFLLERMHTNGAAQAGVYAMAYRLLDASNMLGYLTGSFLVPFFARHRYDKTLVQQVVLISRHGLLLFAVCLVAFVVVFAPWIQGLLYHTTTTYSSRVMQLCLAALPAYYLIQVYSSLLTATAQFRLLLQILFFSALLNLCLNLWLIPLYGAAGCCFAALVSQYTCGLLLWLFACRKLTLAPAVGSFLLYPALFGVMLLLLLVGQKLTANVWIILSSIALMGFVFLFTQRTRLTKLFLSLYK
jgi:O-antigen/teichoic acid export membrane protein